jgi:hypothetical protein
MARQQHRKTVWRDIADQPKSQQIAELERCERDGDKPSRLLLQARDYAARKSVRPEVRRATAPGRIDKSLRQHKEIAAAIRAGDDAGAWQAMYRHINIGGQDVTEFVSRLNPDLLASA